MVTGRGLRAVRRFLNRVFIDSAYVKAIASYDNWLQNSAFSWTVTYVVSNQVVGDYLEFGVYEGSRFALMYELIRNYSEGFYRANELGMNPYEHMRFHAFDSFEGLPPSDPGGRPAQYRAGGYRATEEAFGRTLETRGVDLSRVTITKGWFDKTLTEATARAIKLDSVAIAFVDCDVFESAVPVLRFIRPYLRTGSVLIVDDWYQNRGDPTRGVQGAVLQWLESNKDVTLQYFHSSDAKTWAFIVHVGTYPSVSGIRS